jgi:hypothetical protein
MARVRAGRSYRERTASPSTGCVENGSGYEFIARRKTKRPKARLIWPGWSFPAAARVGPGETRNLFWHVGHATSPDPGSWSGTGARAVRAVKRSLTEARAVPPPLPRGGGARLC